MNGMISLEEAHRRLTTHRQTPEAETVSLDYAQGRLLAEPVRAMVSRPPNAVSAMDGYAVCLSDVRAAGARLKLVGEVPAGTPFSGSIGQGEAVRIFTGGEIPDGADHVVIQEDAEREDATLVCRNAYDKPQFVRAAGLDFRKGDTLLQAGMRLGPGELALAAAANHARLRVYRKLRVGILANGNELRAPGSDLAPGEIVNSNPSGLAALIRDWGGEPVDLGIATDTMEAIRSSIETAPDIDIFLPVGGASVGDHDLMRPAFAAEGFEPVFAKVSVKPGKPTWFSRRNRQLVLGLPGNPASALVCAHLFLRGLLTGQACPFLSARLASPLEANGPREHFMRASLHISQDGILMAKAADNQDSSLISPFIESRALLRRTENAPAQAAGTVVQCLLMQGPDFG